MKKKREITGEIKTTSKPRASGDIKLGATFVLKTLHVANRVSEGLGVGGFAIADGAEIDDRLDDFSGRNVVEESGAGGGVWWLVEEDGKGEERAGGELEKEDGEEGEDEKEDGV